MPTPGNYADLSRTLVNSKTSTVSSAPFPSTYQGGKGYSATMPKGKSSRKQTYGQKHDPVRRSRRR